MPRIPLQFVIFLLGIALALFTLLEVNYPQLSPQSQLAFFAMLGMILCFLSFPLLGHSEPNRLARAADLLLAVLTLLCFGFIILQTEPLFRGWWLNGRSLGNRAGQEAGLDFLVGLIGLLLVLEAARRSIGWTLPLLAAFFLAYAYWGQHLPLWLLPHRGYGVSRIVSQTFLQSQGVFGVALRVMFTYVFLFVILGAFLKATGATQFIVDLSNRFFRNSPSGPAKVAVLSSGLMGSLSGSAVANTATTGTFTIPMMRASGFRPHIAAGIVAAASSGGPLMPPVMGAGAYMMLEIITPPVTYLQIIQAALIPAILYYLSLLLIVHFYSRRLQGLTQASDSTASLSSGDAPAFPLFQGVIFLGAFGGLIGFLVIGYTPFRAVSLALLVIVILSSLHSRTRLTIGRALETVASSSQTVISLVCAAGCVGVVVGVVTLTGVGTKLPAVILALAEGNLHLALLVIMFATIILGMGLPSAVCYLLMATLIGPALGQLGVLPLASHLFIFYFGMMSMVTPPVALAAYAAASIAGTRIMQTGGAAFRFALVGFTLPYMFVFRPELLMLSPTAERAELLHILAALGVAILGVVSFAAGISSYLFHSLSGLMRSMMFLAAGLLLFPGQHLVFANLRVAIHDVLGLALFLVVGFLNWKSRGMDTD